MLNVNQSLKININPMEIKPLFLTDSERKQIDDILRRRANDIASFKTDAEKKLGTTLDEYRGSVDMALTREITRLRSLADKIALPPLPDDF